MTTRVIYGTKEPNGNFYMTSVSTVYATARSMSGTLTLQGSTLEGGQFFSSPNYTITEGFIEFNTGSVAIGAVTSATLAMCTSNATTVNFTEQVRADDWGGTLTTGKAIAGASLSSLALMCHFDVTSGTTTGVYQSFTDDAFAANLNNASNGTNPVTRCIVSSANQASGTAPTGGEVVDWRDPGGASAPLQPAKLTIVDTSTIHSQSFTANASDTFTPSITGVYDVEGWGGGAFGGTSASQESGGGGGGYALQTGISLVQGTAYTVTRGSGGTSGAGDGTDTKFNNGSSDVIVAGGGKSGTGSTGTGTRLGGSGTAGNVRFTAGSGGAAQGGGGSRGGSGGGSSAGTTVGGNDGTVPSGSAGGAGGVAPSGGFAGGAGGASGAAGSAGAGSVGGGSGGGGNGANSVTANNGKVTVYWWTYTIAGLNLSINQAVKRASVW